MSTTQKTKKEEAPKAKTAEKMPTVPEEQSRVEHNSDGSDVVIPPTPANPIADKIVTGVVPGVTDAPTQPGTTQDSEAAKQPDIQGETSESVVNPVAPPVEPQGVPEAVIREVAVPEAAEEPTFSTPGDYGRLRAAFERALSHGNFDVDFARSLKKDAGIL